MSTGDEVTEQVKQAVLRFLSALAFALRAVLRGQAGERRSVDGAVEGACEAARELFVATGGFEIQLAKSSVFINGTRVQFRGDILETLLELAAVFGTKKVGGLSISQPPSREGVRTLISELAKEEPIEHTALEPFSMRTLPVLAEIDLRRLAAERHAELFLGLRELRRGEDASNRFCVVRILQDLVEVVFARPDHLLRLSMTPSGAPVEELVWVNTAILAMVMGRALGLGRSDVVDLGVGALLHDAPVDWFFLKSGLSRSNLLRGAIVGLHRKRFDGRTKARARAPHLLARVTSVAAAYQRIVALTRDSGVTPIEVLQVLMEDGGSGRFDPDLIDLLINVLRAFPVGCRVVLETGEEGEVTRHPPAARWDRPVVRVAGERSRDIDLMTMDAGAFCDRIVGTARYLERERPADPRNERSEQTTEEAEAIPPRAEKEGMDEIFREFLADD